MLRSWFSTGGNLSNWCIHVCTYTHLYKWGLFSAVFIIAAYCIVSACHTNLALCFVVSCLRTKDRGCVLVGKRSSWRESTGRLQLSINFIMAFCANQVNCRFETVIHRRGLKSCENLYTAIKIKKMRKILKNLCSVWRFQISSIRTETSEKNEWEPQPINRVF